MNPTPPITEYAADNDLINKKATETDIAVIAIGRNAGEGRDRKLEDDFNLSDTEKTLIKNVADAFHAQNQKSNCCIKHWRCNRSCKLER